MPHGPILLDNRTLRTNDTEWSPSWRPDYINHIVSDDIAELTYREEPASTSNPIRSDGTRAPSAYWIKRLVVNNPIARAETLNPPGWFCHLSPVCRLAQYSGGSSAGFHAGVLKLDDQNADARARTTFLNKLADASGKDQVSLGVIAGEFRETAGLAADLATSVVSGVRNIARAHRRPPESIANALYVLGREGKAAALKQLGSSDTGLLQNVVNSWLVAQFGLKPLAYDISDGVNYLAAQQAKPDGLQLTALLKGGASEEYKYQRLLNQSSHNGSPVRLTGHFVQKTSVNYAGVYKIPTNPPLQMELGLYNPALLAWELLRFTWMIDYVVDIGGWLRSFMAAQGTSFVEGTRSWTRRAYLDGLSSKNFDGTTVVDPAKVAMMISAEMFERTLLPGVGVMPSFLPGMKNKLNLDRLANSVAAVTTLVGARARYGNVPIISY